MKALVLIIASALSLTAMASQANLSTEETLTQIAKKAQSTAKLLGHDTNALSTEELVKAELNNTNRSAKETIISDSRNADKTETKTTK